MLSLNYEVSGEMAGLRKHYFPQYEQQQTPRTCFIDVIISSILLKFYGLFGSKSIHFAFFHITWLKFIITFSWLFHNLAKPRNTWADVSKTGPLLWNHQPRLEKLSVTVAGVEQEYSVCLVYMKTSIPSSVKSNTKQILVIIYVWQISDHTFSRNLSSYTWYKSPLSY